MLLHGLDGVQGSVLILQSVGTVPMQLDSVLSALATLFPLLSQVHLQIGAESNSDFPRGLIRLKDPFPMVLRLVRLLSSLPTLSYS